MPRPSRFSYKSKITLGKKSEFTKGLGAKGMEQFIADAVPTIREEIKKGNYPDPTLATATSELRHALRYRIDKANSSDS